MISCYRQYDLWTSQAITNIRFSHCGLSLLCGRSEDAWTISLVTRLMGVRTGNMSTMWVILCQSSRRNYLPSIFRPGLMIYTSWKTSFKVTIQPFKLFPSSGTEFIQQIYTQTHTSVWIDAQAGLRFARAGQSSKQLKFAYYYIITLRTVCNMKYQHTTNVRY